MKTAPKTIAVLIAGLISQARPGPNNNLPAVIVYVQHDIHAPAPQMVYCAESLATAMFHKAGVEVSWRMGSPNGPDKKGAIGIEITSSPPPQGIHKDALAFTGDGIHITIVWDRVERTAQSASSVALLAHVLVHEITHVLQRTKHHSDQGVMKAHWTSDDVWLMARKPLRFDPWDMELIRQGLSNRNEGR